MKRKPSSDPHDSYVPGVPDTVGVGTPGDFPGSSGSPSFRNFPKESARSSAARPFENVPAADLRKELIRLERKLSGLRDAFPGLSEVSRPNEAERRASLMIEQASEAIQLINIELFYRGLMKGQQRLRTDHTAKGPDDLAKQRAEPLSAKATTHQGTSVSHRRHRPIDTRKVLIAELKLRHPASPARKICELIDRQIASTPVRRATLAPLEPWQRQAPGKRSWVEVYDHAKTRNLVRSYVNKVPPLKTAKSAK